MRCEQCGHVGDWLDDAGGWTRVNEGDAPAVRPLYECADCGHRQRLR